MVQGEIGVIQLHDRAKLVFSVQHWKGKPFAHVRKFVQSKKYEGPTKSGLSMDKAELEEILNALQKLHQEIPKSEVVEFVKVGKYKGTDIVVSIIKPDDSISLPAVDIREFIETPKYSGPTKKGVRFSWDKLTEVIAIFHIQAQQLEKENGPQIPLFPKSKPQDPSPKKTPTDENHHNSILLTVYPNGFQLFPEDFIKAIEKGKLFNLPQEPISVSTLIDGTCVVKSDFGYCCSVLNPIEGKYIYYSWLRGNRAVNVPEKMIETFKAVKEYENYLREIRLLLMRELERKSGSRSLAEYQTKEIFKKNGLPWQEQS